VTQYGPTLEISEQTHATKYRGEGEAFPEGCARFSHVLADTGEHFKSLYEILLNMRFMGGGRTQAAIGSLRYVTAFNCFVSGTILDSMSDIMDKAAEAAQTMRLGGGIGYGFGGLRPRGDRIVSLGSKSSGPISFMEIYNAVCNTISSAGHRRGAQMGVLPVSHPDIEEFIRAKQNETELRQFNLSIGITDSFMEAVMNKTQFNLEFEVQVYNTIPADNLWNEIMRSTWDWAEPGVLFMDRINEWNNLHYCETIEATNPCVRGDTLILTKKGYKPIEYFHGVRVPVWNGEEWSTVTPTITGSNERMLTVTFSEGSSLDCTHYHKFYLEDNSCVEAKGLKAGDKLLKHSWPVIEGLKKEGLKDAYAQGFFSGDGWTKGTNKNYIGLYGEKKNLVGLFSPLSCNEYQIVGGYEGTDTSQTKLYLYFGANGGDKKFIPGVTYDTVSRANWLAGLIDSDGCAVYSEGGISVQVSSKDRGFLLGVKQMINTLGATASLSDMKDCWRLSISAWNVSLLQQQGLPTYRVDLSENNPSRDGSRFVKVVDVIEAEPAELVYCFTEDKRHMGIFGGVLTGQCGEQPLPPYGACLLGSFNLVKYVDPEKKFFDYEQLKKDIPIVVRAMDNIHDVSEFPLEAQRQESINKRRMGLGVTGVANAGEIQGFPYASPEFMVWFEQVLEVIRDGCYDASIDLAKEKGAFPLFDAVEYGKGKFIKTLPQRIQRRIRKHGIRNSHLLSVAPTGTISLCADNVSSGIEPVFALTTNRTIQTFDGPTNVVVEDYAFREYGVRGKTTEECTAEDHLSMLALTQKYVDSSVSKTINVDPNIEWEDFKNIYIEAYKRGCKGATTFNAGGKRFGILNAVKEEKSEAKACYIDPETGQKECS